jgi:hypothetical protein
MTETMPTETGISFWFAWLLALRLKPPTTAHRRFRGSTQSPHRQLPERGGMDQEKRNLTRNRGLAWVSALTLSAGAAGTVGAVAIAVTLPHSTVTSSVSSAAIAKTTSNAKGSSSGVSSQDDSSQDDSSQDDSTSQSQPAAPSQAQPAAPSQLQPAAPPSNTNNPPAATSGAS